ncbi:hypothetical protein, partial [Acinetobacter baumannii]|uniref:hypothetical protein n=1 Tax=Acinetobacter baumannii TaxID=470 RepID=UPI001C073A02
LSSFSFEDQIERKDSNLDAMQRHLIYKNLAVLKRSFCNPWKAISIENAFNGRQQSVRAPREHS